MSLGWNDIPVVILVAGASRRMVCGNIKLPTALMPVMDRVVLARQVCALSALGCVNFHVVNHEDDEQEIEDAVARGMSFARADGLSDGGGSITHYTLRRHKGAMHALHLPLMEEDFDIPVLLALGDIFFIPRWNRLRRLPTIMQQKRLDAIIVTRDACPSDERAKNFSVEAGPDGLATRLVEKPVAPSAGRKGVGVYLLGPSVLERLRRERGADLTAALQGCIDAGLSIGYDDAVSADVNINRPKDLLDANMAALRAETRRRTASFVSPRAQVDDACRLSRSVVMYDAHVTGAGRLRDSVVFPHASIELLDGEEVTRSLVLNGAIVPVDAPETTTDRDDPARAADPDNRS